MDGFVPPAARSDLLGAAELFARRYGGWLKDKLRLRYGDQADDLAQEALLRAAAHESAAPVDHPKAFLLTVARNLAVDRARKARREHAHNDEAGALQPLVTLASQEDLVLLKQIVLALPPELRDALILTRIKGLSYEDVAALRGLKVRTVKDRVRRALAMTQAMRD